MNHVTFLPEQVTVAARENEPVVPVAGRAGIRIERACGGRGLCRSCIVRFEGRQVPAPSADDLAFFSPAKLEKGWRRGCQSQVLDGARIEVPAGSREGVEPIAADRFAAWFPPDGGAQGAAPRFGVAFDVGTTSLFAAVVDLASGTVRWQRSMLNPQVPWGADVITRLDQSASGAAAELHQLLVDALNRLLHAACSDLELPADALGDAVIAANPVMQHFLLNWETSRLRVAPFQGYSYAGHSIPAVDLGLPALRTCHFLPGVAGFVGGDHVGALLGLRALDERRRTLVLDVGTNTEIALILEGRISSLSCPSGPALEAGNLSCGMRAGTGAIHAVAIDGAGIHCRTLGDVAPRGLCGSAVVQAVARLHATGHLDGRGRIQRTSPHAIEIEGRLAIHLAGSRTHPVYLSQQDIRSVQLAKAAIRAGIDLLLDERGCHAGDIECLVLTGSFGCNLDPECAVSLGLLPPMPLERIEQVPNAAATGAYLALVSMRQRRAANALAAAIRHVEQVNRPAYSQALMRALNFTRPGTGGSA